MVLFRMGLVPCGYIPGKDIQVFREFTCYQSKRVSMSFSEKNCFQNAFAVRGLTLDAGVSNLFGQYVADNENYLLDGDIVDLVQCVSLLRGKDRLVLRRLFFK